MAVIRLEKRADYLVPSLEEDKDKASKIKHGEVIQVEFKRIRNPKFHKKYFALLQIVAEYDDRYDTVNDVLLVMKLKLGHYRTIVNTDGRVIYVPKSISFGSMEQIDFEDFYSRTINKILSDFVTHWVQQGQANWVAEDFERVVNEIAGF